MSAKIESAKLKSEIVLIRRYSSTNVSIYYHFIALALNVGYVVTSINSYVQQIDVLLQKTRADGEKQTAFLKLVPQN